MGAKNHAVILPDVDVDSTVAALTGAAFGAAGQRCMAISAAVFVGGMGKFKEPLIKAAKSLKVREGLSLGGGGAAAMGVGGISLQCYTLSPSQAAEVLFHGGF
jgi:hypothetical protein